MSVFEEGRRFKKQNKKQVSEISVKPVPILAQEPTPEPVTEPTIEPPNSSKYEGMVTVMGLEVDNPVSQSVDKKEVKKLKTPIIKLKEV